jgi:hypothetical protein
MNHVNFGMCGTISLNKSKFRSEEIVYVTQKHWNKLVVCLFSSELACLFGHDKTKAKKNE